jgi:hypothetical protein
MLGVFVPTKGERASLAFLVGGEGPPGGGGSGYWVRYGLAAGLFGLGAWVWLSTAVAPLGLVLVLVGHLPLWVRPQRLAPGGATPVHEEVWAPVEEGWYERIVRHEQAGARWDATPWDVTNGLGCLTLLGAAGVLGVVTVVASAGEAEVQAQLLALFAVLFVPVWLNGWRHRWNASELRLKGKALEVALAAARTSHAWFEPVPLLALREGRRGRYPVDARLMLRPKGAAEGSFLGVQVQVTLNTVNGVRYPYLYCVVLAKAGYRFPSIRKGDGLVTEQETKEGVSYVVIRQHADNSGGWHTKDGDIARIVGAAMDLGARCLP